MQSANSKNIAARKVSFTSDGIVIAGILYIPEQNNIALPGIVVSHPGTGVKEQTAGLYARELAAQGFITLAFDAAYQGESGGLPRGLEDPAQRVQDINAAVAYMTTLPGVNADHIGLLGICASGGYAIPATATDPNIKALATVCGVSIGAQFRNGADGKQDPAVLQHLLDAAAADSLAVAGGREPGSFPLFPASEAAARALPLHGFEGWEYYCTDRGQHANSAKTFTWSSIPRIASFYTSEVAALIQQPVLMIAGSEAVTRWTLQPAYDNMKGEKTAYLVQGATHVDLYDKPAYVAEAVQQLAVFFSRHLQA